MKETQTGAASRSSLITIAVIVILLGIAAFMLPRGYNDDLSEIGKGSNVVVLIQNKGVQQSMTLITLLNQVRHDYEGKIEFILADIDTPEGKAFQSEQKLGSSILVCFAPDGTRLNVIDNNIDEADLHTALDNTFRLAP